MFRTALEGDRGPASVQRAVGSFCAPRPGAALTRERLRAGLRVAARWRTVVKVSGLVEEGLLLNGEYRSKPLRSMASLSLTARPTFWHKAAPARIRFDETETVGVWVLELVGHAGQVRVLATTMQLNSSPLSVEQPPLPPEHGWAQREGCEEPVEIFATVRRVVSLDDESLVKGWSMLGSLLRSDRGTAAEPGSKHLQAVIAQLYDLPFVYTAVCAAHRTTLNDLQTALMPSWEHDVAFATRKECEAALDVELPEHEVFGQCRVHKQAWYAAPSLPAYFLELLDGSVLVRTSQAPVFPADALWTDSCMISAALLALRHVDWTPSFDWAFPRRQRLYFQNLRHLRSSVGRADVMNAVLPFLGHSRSDQDQPLREGQPVTAFVERWVSSCVERFEPITKSVEVAAAPGFFFVGPLKALYLRDPGYLARAAKRPRDFTVPVPPREEE